MSGIEELDYWDDEDFAEWLRQADLEEMLKASFGGDRSAAGRYAAEQRWKGHVKREDKPRDRSKADLDAEVSRVSKLLADVAKLPQEPAEDVVLTPEEWENHTGTRYVTIKTNKGDTYLVVTKQVLEVEQAVNALGKRVLGQIQRELVESGEVTEEQLRRAIEYRGSLVDDLSTPQQKLTERAMAGDKSVPEVVLNAANSLKEIQARLTTAKGAVIKASRAESKFLDQNRRVLLRVIDPNDSNAEAIQREYQRLLLEKANAQTAVNAIKGEVHQAESALKTAVYSQISGEENLKGFTDRKNQIVEERANALFVQEAIGRRFEALLASRRKMGTEFPVRQVVPPSEDHVDKLTGARTDAATRAKQVLDGVAARLPDAILQASIFQGQKVMVDFSQGRGGFYRSTAHLIAADTEDLDTLTHETVHAVSMGSEEARLMEQAALQRRIFGKENKPAASFVEKLKAGLQKVVDSGKTFNLGRLIQGIFIRDQFINGYQGRSYDIEETMINTIGPYATYGKQEQKAPSKVRFEGSTEILTVATEAAFGAGFLMRTKGRVDDDLLATAMGWLLTGEGGQ